MKKLPRMGWERWILVAAVFAGFNLLAARAHAIPTKLNNVFPAVVENALVPAEGATVLGWLAGSTSLPKPIVASWSGKKDNEKDKDKSENGKGKDKDKEGKGNDHDEEGNGDYGHTPASVPDGGNTVALLGAAFLGLALAGRKVKGMVTGTH